MSALTDAQLDLLKAAHRGLLATAPTASKSPRFFLNGIEVEVELGWVAADLLVDGWLFLPASRPAKYRPVHPTARAIDLLYGGQCAPR